MTLKSGLEVTQDHQTGTIRKFGRGFLFAFHSNYGCILHHFRGRKSYFFHTPLHSTPQLGGIGGVSEYCYPVWCRKTEMVGLPDGEKSLMICLAVSTEYRRVTDGRTDRHLATA